MSALRWVVAALVALGLAVACGPSGPATQQGAGGVASAPAGAAQGQPADRAALPADARGGDAGWQRDWDRLVAAAQQEGRLVVAGPAFAQIRQQLPVEFKQRFGITMEYT